MLKKLVPETCMTNLTQVHHSFLHNLTIELCLSACNKLAQEKTCTRLTDTRASFLYKTTCTNFWYKFLERVSPA